MDRKKRIKGKDRFNYSGLFEGVELFEEKVELIIGFFIWSSKSR